MLVLALNPGAPHTLCGSGIQVAQRVRPKVLFPECLVHMSLSCMFRYQWVLYEANDACVKCFRYHDLDDFVDF